MDKLAYNMLKARWHETGENVCLFTGEIVSRTSALNWQSDLPLQCHNINAYLKALHTRTTTGTFRKLHATCVFARVLQEEAAKATNNAELIAAFNAAQETARVYLNHQLLDKIYYNIHKSIVIVFCVDYGFRLRQLLTNAQLKLNWLRASNGAINKYVIDISSTAAVALHMLEHCSSPPPTVDAPQSTESAPLALDEANVRFFARCFKL